MAQKTITIGMTDEIEDTRYIDISINADANLESIQEQVEEFLADFLDPHIFVWISDTMAIVTFEDGETYDIDIAGIGV